MMSMFKASPKVTLDEVRAPILAYFARKTLRPRRPVLLGQIATELKCSLNIAEGYLQSLVEEGLIREMTPEETKDHGILHGFFLNQK
jgi:predicted ArsR family transcriptional regulator